MNSQIHQHRRHHQITTYSDSMSAISDRAGDLVAVFTGAASSRNAAMCRDMLDAIEYLTELGVTDIEAFFSHITAQQERELVQ